MGKRRRAEASEKTAIKSDRRTHRGTKLPKGRVTLDDVRALPAFAGKSHMTVRRAIAAARAGLWLAPGKRVAAILYDAAKVRELVAELEQRRARRGRRVSTLPHECPAGWGTVDEIWWLFAGTPIDPYWRASIREDLANGVACERVVLRRIRLVFPIARGLHVLGRRWSAYRKPG